MITSSPAFAEAVYTARKSFFTLRTSRKLTISSSTINKNKARQGPRMNRRNRRDPFAMPSILWTSYSGKVLYIAVPCHDHFINQAKSWLLNSKLDRRKPYDGFVF